MVRVKNFLSIFAKNGQSNLVLILESKGPYYVSIMTLPVLLIKTLVVCCRVGLSTSGKYRDPDCGAERELRVHTSMGQGFVLKNHIYFFFCFLQVWFSRKSLISCLSKAQTW